MASKKTSHFGFWKSIPASIYGPELYAQLPTRSFWKSFWYLLGLCTIMVSISAFFIFVLPFLLHRDMFSAAVDQTIHSWPEELTIIVQDGEVVTNVPEPYYLPVSDVIPEELWTSDEKISDSEVDFYSTNALVIDTKTAYSFDQFEDYNTIFWLTRDSIYVMKDDNSAEAYSLADVDNVVVDKTVADGIAEKVWDEMNNFIPVVLVFGFLLAIVGVFAFRLVQLLLLALGVWIIQKILKLSWGYAAAYKVAIHAITLASFVGMLCAVTFRWTGFNGFPFMFTLITFIMAAVNLEKAKRL